MANQNLSVCFMIIWYTVFQIICYLYKGEWKYSDRERLAVARFISRFDLKNLIKRVIHLATLCSSLPYSSIVVTLVHIAILTYFSPILIFVPPENVEKSI